jgi:UDP-N-acetylglucosamine:LPS N-acetylglucosamine transferase
MTEKVAIVYWCDGAGHAARSIPVAKELRSRGVEVAVAGGGRGKEFVEMNGFEHPDLTTVTVEGSTPLSFLRHTLFDLIPSSVRRMREVYRWLQAEDPDVLVTDDVFAGLAAAALGIEFYRIDHLTPELLDPVWTVPLRIYNGISLAFAEGIIVTSLWAEEPDPEGITRVGPLAQEGEASGEIEPYDVLLNPGTHGENFDEIRRLLEADGFDGRTGGDDNWETKPTMTPYTAAADVVICTGFSSIADTVVAGTPCVIYPFLPFQKALAARAEDKNIEGVARASTVTEAVEKAKHYCASEERPDYENGAPAFVDVVLGE